MRRREFITLIGGASAAWPLAARAQQPDRMRHIGVLMAHAESDPEFQTYVSAFREGLQKLGWTEGRNIQLDFRWGALDDAEMRQRSALELIALKPDLIVTQNTPPTASMLQQTRTIPVVFVIVADPLGSGFVKSLARPGGNATGFTIMEPTTTGKWLELLKEIAPRSNRATLLFNQATAPYASIYLNPVQSRRCVARVGVDRRNCSRQSRTRNRHRSAGTRAKWRIDRDTGWLSERPSRGHHRAGCSLPSAYHLPVAFLR
jgi:putative ABC transport system substrate-binding protein